MAMDTTDLTVALAAFGRESSQNLTMLRQWRNAAIDELAAGKGAQVVSGSGSGLAFSVSPTTTMAEWFKALQAALDMASLGQRTTSLRVFF